jgi:glyoxylase-like metal-dependent hydrolase (beta-lactamase superfamily II)
LRKHGYDAYTVRGGMAAWETVYVARDLAPTGAVERIVQLDRVGKGALSYVLVSRGEAVVVDPGRHVERYDAILAETGARPVAVVETHMHADFLSGARAAAAQWNVPYRVHAADTRSPFDDKPGKLTYTAVAPGQRIPFGRAALEALHTPGHTLGSLTYFLDGDLALTGDFVFVRSVGRPDLGGQTDAWTKQLWTSLERARREWPGALLVLPAHYAAEVERRADRAVAARWDIITATNPVVAIRREGEFVQWVVEHADDPPLVYRTMKLANLGLLTVAAADAETLESGPNVCAI